MNKTSWTYSSALLLLLALAVVLASRGVVQSVAMPGDIRLEADASEYRSGNTLTLRIVLDFADQELAAIDKATLVIEGPQPHTLQLPLTPGTYDLSSGDPFTGTLVATVKHIQVIPAETQPGSPPAFKGVGEGARIEIEVKWKLLDRPPPSVGKYRAKVRVEIPGYPVNESGVVQFSIMPVTLRVIAPPAAVPGSQFDVALQVDSVADLGDMNMTLVYDKDLLTIVDIRFDPALIGCLFDGNDIPVGLRIFLVCLDGRPVTDLAIALVRFEALPADEQVATSLDTADLVMTNSDIEHILAQGIGDTITVVPGKCGDVSGDGALDMADAVAMLQIAVQQFDPSLAQTALGDLNRDGRINIVDVAMGLQQFVGLIPSPTECGPNS